ncbi:MAG: hypothetical protein HZA25_00565 [Candidatus Niyogibacteria bacterium]|nr:hypothetical protein [Candidatus Niyogibacteria bacterium]
MKISSYEDKMECEPDPKLISATTNEKGEEVNTYFDRNNNRRIQVFIKDGAVVKRIISDNDTGEVLLDEAEPISDGIKLTAEEERKIKASLRKDFN